MKHAELDGKQILTFDAVILTQAGMCLFVGHTACYINFANLTLINRKMVGKDDFYNKVRYRKHFI